MQRSGGMPPRAENDYRSVEKQHPATNLDKTYKKEITLIGEASLHLKDLIKKMDD